MNSKRNGPQGRRTLVAVFVSLAAINAAVYLRGVLASESRYLLINADDAGMYPSVNRATIQALESRAVSSCSIMVPCPAFHEFAAYAAAHPEKDFGVHLTLNCDTERFRWGPVLPKIKVPSLVGPDGYLWATAQETAQHAQIDEVEAELKAQIDGAQTAGIRISHLDHHMFVLFRRPDFVRLYVKLGLEYGLPIRYMKAIPIDYLDPDDPAIVQAYQDGLKALERRGMPVFDEINSQNYHVSPAQKQSYFVELVERLQPGVSEFVIHCADGQNVAMRAPDSDRREADLRVFTSQEMRDRIRQAGVKVINWKQFWELKRHW